MVTEDDTHYVVETKGLEDVNVAHKDRAARIWCENASILTETTWEYIKVRQTEYTQLQLDQFEDILVFATGDSNPLG